MSDHEIESAAHGLRSLVQESTTYTRDAMDICLRAAATFAADECTDGAISAERFRVAAEVVAESLRRGRRLDS